MKSPIGTVRLCVRPSMRDILAAETTIDLAEELHEHRVAECADRSDDDHHNEAADEAILDRCGASRIPRQPR